MSAARATSVQPYAAVARRAALWLVFLAPFFYATYGFANWAASRREHIGSIVYGWEHHIPFLAWTIIPYWTINAFYALSLFANRATGDVDRLACRYLTAQVVAVACFLAFPLAASFTRPETGGLPGILFGVLGGFDKPFNQAPSLHIALALIIWDHMRRRLAVPWRAVWHVWCVLIAASVLTTYQHHFIDIPTGALLGFVALWLFPAQGPLPLSGFAFTHDPKRRRLAGYYAAGSLALLAAATIGAFASATWLVLLWPCLALVIVAIGYAGAGEKVFQKAADGRVSLASRWLLFPYRIGTRINAWAWTRNLPPQGEVADNVWLGRFPSPREAARFATVIDLAAELERPAHTSARWRAFPMLDLVQSPTGLIAEAAGAVENARTNGPVLVCCALGFQRSAAVVAQWLVATGRAGDFAAAEIRLQQAGRRIVLHVAPADIGNTA